MIWKDSPSLVGNFLIRRKSDSADLAYRDRRNSDEGSHKKPGKYGMSRYTTLSTTGKGAINSYQYATHVQNVMPRREVISCRNQGLEVHECRVHCAEQSGVRERGSD